jgi:hypothetical protein
MAGMDLYISIKKMSIGKKKSVFIVTTIRMFLYEFSYIFPF